MMCHRDPDVQCKLKDLGKVTVSAVFKSVQACRLYKGQSH